MPKEKGGPKAPLSVTGNRSSSVRRLYSIQCSAPVAVLNRRSGRRSRESADGQISLHRLPERRAVALHRPILAAAGNLDCQRLEPATDLSGAMAATMEGLAADAWQAEGTADYGSVFVQRAGERRLLMLTPQDSYDTTPQSFNPFRSQRHERNVP
jgi:hypothetical protein